jgi:hypothetical protein
MKKGKATTLSRRTCKGASVVPQTRHDFPKPTVDALCKRAAYICSNPDCRVHTLAPSEKDEGRFLYIRKAAHICAATEGGPRYESQMSPEERSAAANAIFLCSSCADLIDKNNGADFSIELLHRWKADHEKWVAENLNKRGTGRGGDGGGGTIIGGRGGDGGTQGIGGKGGSGFIQGNDGVIVGGDGGSCPSPDGRGGGGARGPTERLGFPTYLWGFGRGAPDQTIRNMIDELHCCGQSAHSTWPFFWSVSHSSSLAWNRFP